MDDPFIQDDFLLLAYECRQTNMGSWAICQHPYCTFIRHMSQHFDSNYYHGNHNRTCERCSNFKEMLNKHISSCTNPHCPVPMCRSTRQQQQLYPNTYTTNAQFQLKRRHSAPVVERDSVNPGQAVSVSVRTLRPGPGHGLRMLSRSNSFSAGDLQGQESQSDEPMLMSALRARLEEVINQLDRGELLMPYYPVHMRKG